MTLNLDNNPNLNNNILLNNMIYKATIKSLIHNNDIESAKKKWEEAKEKKLLNIPACIELIVFTVNKKKFNLAFFLQQDTLKFFCTKDNENFISINCILSILGKELINNIPKTTLQAYLKIVTANCKNLIAYYNQQSLEQVAQSSTNQIKKLILNNDLTSKPLEKLQNIFKTGEITYFLEASSKKFKQKTITKNEYKFLLITPDKDGCTPFHKALISKPETIDDYLETIFKIENILEPEEYKALLTAPDKDGYTPLHYALKAKFSLIVSYYFSTLHKAIDKQIITKDEYKTLLTKTDKDDHTPLHQALISTRSGIVDLYVKEIRKMIYKQIITKDEYKTLLTKTDKDRCTPLHYAANSNNLEVFNCLVEELKEFLDSDELYDALYAINISALIPACETKKTHAKTINEHLDNLKKEHKSTIKCKFIRT